MTIGPPVRIVHRFRLDDDNGSPGTGELQLFYLKDATIMNLHQVSGINNLVIGTFAAGLGRLIGNNQLRQSGFARQMRGKSQSAIGDAQNIIKMCVKRNGLAG